MRLAIDAVGAKYGGAATVLLSIVEAVLRNDRVERAFLFCSPAPVRRFDLPSGTKVTVLEKQAAEGSAGGRLAWHLLGLRREVERVGADAMLCLSGGGIPPRNVPCADFVQQPLPFFPEGRAELSFKQKFRIAVLTWDMRIACRRSALVVVQTPTMKERVVSRFGAADHKVHVIEPAHGSPAGDPGPSTRLTRMREAPGPRFLYVGSDSAYKNVSILAPATRLLRTLHPQSQMFLTLPEDHPLCRAEGVVGLGRLPPSVVAEAYSLCTALVMPSLVETLGLPLLEAAAAGRPIIAADRPYARDVCGDSALYFDPTNQAELSERMARIVEDQGLRGILGEKGRRRIAAKLASCPYDRLVTLVVDMAEKANQRPS